MLVKLGPLVTEVAGSMGGMTMQRSPDGTIARAKPLPINRRSSYKSSANQRLQTLNQVWRTLSLLDRAAWDAFAATQTWYNRFGDPVTGSGYRAFLKNNAASHASANTTDQVAIQTTAPTTTYGTLPTGMEWFYDTGTPALLFKSPDPSVDPKTDLWFWTTPPVSGGRSAYYGRWEFMKREFAGSPLPIDWTSAYMSMFGALPDATTGQICFLRVQAVDYVNYYPALDAVIPLTY